MARGNSFSTILQLHRWVIVDYSSINCEVERNTLKWLVLIIKIHSFGNKIQDFKIRACCTIPYYHWVYGNSSGYLSNKRDLHRVCVVTNAMMYVGHDLVLFTSRSVQSSRCVDLQLSWFVHMSHAEAFYNIRIFTILGRNFCLPLKSFLLALVCIKFRFFFHLEMDFHLIYISTQLRKHHRKKMSSMFKRGFTSADIVKL